MEEGCSGRVAPNQYFEWKTEGVPMTRNNDCTTIEEKVDSFEMKEVNLENAEELEMAIAPGIIGFGCGCNVGNLGVFCG